MFSLVLRPRIDGNRNRAQAIRVLVKVSGLYQYIATFSRIVSIYLYKTDKL